MKEFKYATGSTLTVKSFLSHEMNIFYAEGLSTESCAAGKNTDLLNELLEMASKCGKEGGTVVIPAGVYAVYTLHMKSYVTLYLEKGTVLEAAKPTEKRSYDEPEVNLYAGLQDHGHTYMANSLIYGTDLEDVEIAGPGMFHGVEALERWDPEGNENREKKGHQGNWCGNKGIGLRRCKNVILREFTFYGGGHFALLLSGCQNVLAENVTVDTERDAFDIDGCSDVTVRGGWYNSPNDDALCLKADYGASGFYPVQNVILENSTVSGFDVGSVVNQTYTGNQMIAADRCRPTGRIKFGTEASCGCNTVWARNMRFLRSRGFCMESCDGAEMHDILLEDCCMEEVSSSPVFIRVGCRDRFPVTGFHTDGMMRQEKSVRLSEQEWVLPDTELYEKHPIQRYAPCYDRSKSVETESGTKVTVVNPEKPCRINTANYVEKDGKYFRLMWKDGLGYSADLENEIPQKDLPLYANGIGAPELAKCWNIGVRRLRVKDADPRYPILLMGLSDSKIQDVFFEDVEVEYRGGLTLQDAADQRQIGTRWAFENYRGETEIQILPWMVNTFFTKNEALLPRYDWSETEKSWIADPYNVPEMPHMYPEPSNWGILPAYGLYARHVENLKITGMKCSTMIQDKRHFSVLDDVHGVNMVNVSYRNGTSSEKITIREDERGCGSADIMLVRSEYRRPTGLEYVPDYPYHTECVTEYDICSNLSVQEVRIPAPAPGTPADTLYQKTTFAVRENAFSYPVRREDYKLAALVYRPYMVSTGAVQVRAGEVAEIPIIVRNPAENELIYAGNDISSETDWIGNLPNHEGNAAALDIWATVELAGAEAGLLQIEHVKSETYLLKLNIPKDFGGKSGSIRVYIKDEVCTEEAKIKFTAI